VLRVKDPGRARPFRVPGGLIIPVLGIISCLYLIYYLPPTSWLRFAAWLNLGFVIYVGYGSVKSRLTGRDLAADTAEHDVQTAYLGAWLGVIGAALLFFMRGFDLWLDAMKEKHSAVTAFGDVMHLGPWLEVSWFLIVPLALNAFILCPIIITRALRAKKKGCTASTANVSLVIAIVLAVFSAVFLLLVALEYAKPPAITDSAIKTVLAI
jgi:hypothetical protein